MTATMSDQATEQARADDFNRAHPVGAYVRYWTGVREGDGKVGTTRTAAQLLGGHTAVVWVEGVGSCIALTHVEPLPDQPDGIEDDSRDLPDPERAVERVLQYVTESGDGLYDVQGGAPLYGRDLEAICRTVEQLRDKLDLVRLANVGKRWLVWSHEHSTWWGPNAHGYDRRIEYAGRYTEPAAKEACVSRTWTGKGVPPEVMVLSPEAEPIPNGVPLDKEMHRRIDDATRRALQERLTPAPA